MDTLTSLRVFITVAECKSFSAAAERLSMSPAMASKHIQHLEQRLGSRLLNRTSRNVSLTETGVDYRHQVRVLLEGLDEVEARVSQANINPRGVLKISLPIWMATSPFTRLIARYTEQFPDVVLDLDFSGRMVNLVEEGFDLGLRSTLKPDEGLIARKLPDNMFVLVASPSFLEKVGRPATVDDLEGQAFLAYSHYGADGQIQLKSQGDIIRLRFRPVLRSVNELLLLDAAREGLGYVFLPLWLARHDIESGILEQVLADITSVTVPFLAVYPNRGNLPAKTRSFLDFIAREFAKALCPKAS
ncbi:LysR family transcriptional regulator [Rhizobium sp. FKY42]|uniref:LysR family transcriptional regulator n=1 Tax=Rhizobium sp. FKY42 TaxID=2562310 RepID=UPI0010C13576|nr:LysR family transcriptional regulator [Rhizobium sp. FKY42]